MQTAEDVCAWVKQQIDAAWEDGQYEPELRDSRCFSRRDAWSHGAFRSAGAVSKRYCPEEREDPWPNDRGEWGISNRGVRVERSEKNLLARERFLRPFAPVGVP